jgi:hypothetical protein
MEIFEFWKIFDFGKFWILENFGFGILENLRFWKILEKFEKFWKNLDFGKIRILENLGFWKIQDFGKF